MKYRVLCDFRNGKDKFKKGKVYEIEDGKVEELVKAGLITEYKDEDVVFKETAILENLRAEKVADSQTIKGLQEEVKELKSQQAKAPTEGEMKVLEYIFQLKNLEKMEISLIEGLGEILGLEVFGANKKEKSQSLFDQVTG